MRITKDHVPPAAQPAARRSLPEAPEAVWTALAVGGAALVATGDFLPAAAGAVALAIGCHRIGFASARRGSDPRVGELIRERDHWKALADWAGRQLTAPAPVAAPAPAGDEPADQPDGGQPRPSAGIRGGGRPGAVGSTTATIRGLDAPLPGEDGGLTE